MNTMYFGPGYIGTPYQHVELIYDTGSDWIVVEAKQCATCLNNTYDSTLSTTHSRVDNDYVEHLYGSAQLYGYDATDVFSLDSAGITEIRPFEFFEIYKQTGLVSNLNLLICNLVREY